MTHAAGDELIRLQQAVLGRYSLERELGRGGMGVVFLARDVALDRLVAIKLLPPALAAKPALRERFLHEAQVAARLSHPNIIPIFSVETSGDLVFFVMAFVDGETLGQRIRGAGPLPPAEGMRVLQEVAWALGYAHKSGVVHRDIKPDNIMIERGSGRALVADFGIAGGTGGGGEIVGTAEYMSPEQCEGRPLDGRSDLYALGATMFYALSGRHPFEAEDTHALLAMHLTIPAPRLAESAPGMPRRLATAVDRCLSKNPDARFPNGEAVADALSAAAFDRPKDLPAPLRAWVTKGDDLRSLYGIYGGVIMVPSWMFIIIPYVESLMWAGGGRIPWVLVPYVLAVNAFPFALHAAYRLFHTRRVMEAGYSLDDLRMALKAYAERRREELAFERNREPSLPAKTLRALTWTGFGASIAATAGLMLIPTFGRMLSSAAFIAIYASPLVGALLSHTWPGKRLAALDPTAERRAAAWKGKFGAWTAKLASLFLRPRAAPAEMTHRATELAISLAADALFASLPKELRREFKELPGIVERLKTGADAMRAAGDEAGLAAAVAALERIRIDLLRLKAGSGSPAELTADLGAARDLSRDVDLQVAAQREVSQLLGGQPFRRTPPTPRPSNA